MVTIYWYGAKRPSSKECLAFCAAHYAGQPLEGALSRWEAARTDAGKPYFPQAPRIHCSVSHSGDYWLGAFSRLPLGIDLQKHVDVRFEKISRRFFRPQEDAYLKSVGYRDFFKIWTAKESFVKQTGEGFSGFSRFAVAGPEGPLQQLEGLCLRFVPFREGYTLCVCTRQTEEVTFLPGPLPSGGG